MKDTLESKNIVVGIGEILWDTLPEGRRLGGAPANFALHCNSLGGQCKIISAVGQDKSGLDIIRQLSDKQLDTYYIRTNRNFTGWVDIEICNNGHPKYVIHENAAWDHIEISPADIQLARSCSAVCFGTLAQRNPTSRESIHTFLANTNETCLRIFDVNLRQNYYSKEIITHSLQVANILKLNKDELSVLQDLIGLPATKKSALHSLIDRYQLDLIALTQGDSGSIIIDHKNTSYCPAIPATVKDTIGAGDAFTATIAMAKLYGLSLENINLLASEIAAYVCSHTGATPDLPNDLISKLTNKSAIPVRKILSPAVNQTHIITKN